MGDAGRKTGFAPLIHLDDFVYYPVSRTGKRITAIACCWANGSHIRPAVIIARKAFQDKDLATLGLTSEKLEGYLPTKALINREILENWFMTTPRCGNPPRRTQPATVVSPSKYDLYDAPKRHMTNG
jgi:hypothetical protein